MVDVKKFSEIDIYGLIEVDISATEQEVSISFTIYSQISQPYIFPDSQSLSQKGPIMPS